MKRNEGKIEKQINVGEAREVNIPITQGVSGIGWGVIFGMFIIGLVVLIGLFHSPFQNKPDERKEPLVGKMDTLKQYTNEQIAAHSPTGDDVKHVKEEEYEKPKITKKKTKKNQLVLLKINCSQNEIQNIINNHLASHLKNNRIKFTTNTQLKTITHELVINVKMTKQKKEVGVLPLFLVKFNIDGNLTNRKDGEQLSNFYQNSELFNTTDETEIPQKFDEWLPAIDSQLLELFQEMKNKLEIL